MENKRIFDEEKFDNLRLIGHEKLRTNREYTSWALIAEFIESEMKRYAIQKLEEVRQLDKEYDMDIESFESFQRGIDEAIGKIREEK